MRSNDFFYGKKRYKGQVSWCCQMSLSDYLAFFKILGKYTQLGISNDGMPSRARNDAIASFEIPNTHVIVLGFWTF